MARDDRERVQQELEKALAAQFGSQMISGSAAVSAALGYPTQAAFRKALSTGKLPVEVFTIAGRRGKFVMVKDVAAWMTTERLKSTKPGPPGSKK